MPINMKICDRKELEWFQSLDSVEKEKVLATSPFKHIAIHNCYVEKFGGEKIEFNFKQMIEPVKNDVKKEQLGYNEKLKICRKVLNQIYEKTKEEYRVLIQWTNENVEKKKKLREIMNNLKNEEVLNTVYNNLNGII